MMSDPFYLAYFPHEIAVEAAIIARSCQNREFTDNKLLNERLKDLWLRNADQLGVPDGEPCLVTDEFVEYLQGWRWSEEGIAHTREAIYVLPHYRSSGVVFIMADGTWIGAIGGETSDFDMARRMRQAWLKQEHV